MLKSRTFVLCTACAGLLAMAVAFSATMPGEPARPPQPSTAPSIAAEPREPEPQRASPAPRIEALPTAAAPPAPAEVDRPPVISKRPDDAGYLALAEKLLPTEPLVDALVLQTHDLGPPFDMLVNRFNAAAIRDSLVHILAGHMKSFDPAVLETRGLEGMLFEVRYTQMLQSLMPRLAELLADGRVAIGARMVASRREPRRGKIGFCGTYDFSPPGNQMTLRWDRGIWSFKIVINRAAASAEAWQAMLQAKVDLANDRTREGWQQALAASRSW